MQPIARLERAGLKAPVNHVCFLSEHVVAVASGLFLSCYSVLSGACLVGPVDVFDTTERIHGIVVRDGDGVTAPCFAAVYGAKSVAFVTIDLRDDPSTASVTRHAHRKGRDWIKAVAFLAEGGYAAVTAHNRLEVFAALDSPTPATVYQSEERCLLYSAALHGDSLANLVVASGTVFNQVLLWRPSTANDRDNCPVATRLIGHEGVLFHLHFAPLGDRIASVSDDRTVRVWDTRSGECRNTFYGHTSRVWMARLVAGDRLVSVSEDSTCRVWRLDVPQPASAKAAMDLAPGDPASPCAAVWEGHLGKNVWCVAVNPTSALVATGGNDGGVRVWNLASLASQRIEFEDQLQQLPSPAAGDHARNFVLAGDHVVMLSRTGALATCTPATRAISPILSDAAHRPAFNTLAASPDGRLVVSGGLDGDCLFVSPTSAFAPFRSTLHRSKVMFVAVFDGTDAGEYTVVSHEQGNTLAVSRADPATGTVTQIAAYAGPESAGKEPTVILDVQIADEVLLVTTRDGLLAVYPRAVMGEGEPAHPILVFPGGHGQQAMTSVAVVPSSAANVAGEIREIALVSTGRDGFLVHWQLRRTPQSSTSTATTAARPAALEADFVHAEEQALAAAQRKLHGAAIPKHVAGQSGSKVKRKYASDLTSVSGTHAGATWTLTKQHKERVTRGWLERAVFAGPDRERELLLVGFYQKRMFVHNHASGTPLLSVACGGAHRLWHVQARDASGDGVVFAFIRKDVVYYYAAAAAAPEGGVQAARPGPRVLDGLHGREIRTCIFLPGVSDYVLTGSEDTTLAVVRLAGADTTPLTVTGRLSKHVSVVKAAARAGSTVFTAGGCEELFAWTCVPRAEGGQPPALYDVARYAPSSATLETRIMALAAVPWVPDVAVVVAGFSDGRVQVVLYVESHARFYVVAEASVDRCVLSVACAQVGKEFYALAGATNGHVYAWPVAKLVAAYLGAMQQADDGADATTFSVRPESLRQRVVPLADRADAFVHQSGVNDMDVVVDKLGNLAIVTGGDDNAVAVTRLDAATGALTRVWQCETAHGASVTGVKWIGRDQFVSAGVDQRVNVWSRVEVDAFAITHAVVADVSDITSVDVCGSKLVVAGLGVQQFTMQATD
ncbi:WD repeat-containing protein 6 [Blastocladiella emersonii ATCC 22665]|nr:WD repeat-containing protein 6 [Blastocladiella emersonii ATCC 22665]